MRQHQIWKSSQYYAISDLGKTRLNFATNKDFNLKYKKHLVIETETAVKPAFMTFLEETIKDDGVHPVYNSKKEACEQIVNVPDKIISSKEILEHLNTYTILPQSTPPWDEIIFKLKCYSETLTNDYSHNKMISQRVANPGLIDNLMRSEDDVDEHYFVTAPKISEKKRGYVFHLPKPNRAHRRWVILSEYYDYKKNSWVHPDSGELSKREDERVELIDKKKQVNNFDLDEAKKKFFKKGGKVTNLDGESKTEFDWKKLKIHPLALLIPVMQEGDRSRLKEDIRIHGVNEALWLHEGKVLEGRTRYGICLELGIKPDFKAFKGACSPRTFVLSMNIHRRHLTPSQLAAFGVEELLEDLEKEAKERKRTNMNSVHTQKVEYAQKGESAELLGKFLKVNKQYIYDAKSIKEKSPETFKKIVSGDLTISEAKLQLKPTQPKKKKKRRSRKFENKYREMIEKTLNLPYRGHEDIYRTLSKIYLRWNRRNDKKMICELESLEEEFCELFLTPNKPHLSLLEM